MAGGICDRWVEQSPGFLSREDPTGTVNGYLLRVGLPQSISGAPSSRLPDNWRALQASGIRCWWRIDGAEERWRPAGDEIERASQHVGWHVCAVELSVTDHDMGPCPECARIEKRAEAFR